MWLAWRNWSWRLSRFRWFHWWFWSHREHWQVGTGDSPQTSATANKNFDKAASYTPASPTASSYVLSWCLSHAKASKSKDLIFLPWESCPKHDAFISVRNLKPRHWWCTDLQAWSYSTLIRLDDMIWDDFRDEPRGSTRFVLAFRGFHESVQEALE